MSAVAHSSLIRLSRISRPKLAFPQGANTHWGILIQNILSGDCWVWHTTPEKGAHAVSMEAFAAGLPCQLEEIPVTPEIVERLAQSMADPSPYDPLLDNCQQLVTAIAEGRPRSPTALLVLGLALGLILLWSTRNRTV